MALTVVALLHNEGDTVALKGRRLLRGGAGKCRHVLRLMRNAPGQAQSFPDLAAVSSHASGHRHLKSRSHMSKPADRGHVTLTGKHKEPAGQFFGRLQRFRPHPADLLDRRWLGFDLRRTPPHCAFRPPPRRPTQQPLFGAVHLRERNSRER